LAERPACRPVRGRSGVERVRDRAVEVGHVRCVRPPDTAAAWSGLGLEYERVNDLARAEASHLRALALEFTPEVAVRYADFLRRQERAPEAERYYREALARDPDLVLALVGLARLELARGQVDQALQSLARAARHAPDDYAVNFFLAQAYERASRRSDAAAFWDRAGDIVPDLIEPP
jgi:tetratricopeptide (TPR) repeat protein